MVVKRIIAMPGDFVYNRRSNVITKVPPGHCWLEGDNGNASYDSNEYVIFMLCLNLILSYGPVPLNLILGKIDRVIIPQEVYGKPLSPSNPDFPPFFEKVLPRDLPHRRGSHEAFRV